MRKNSAPGAATSSTPQKPTTSAVPRTGSTRSFSQSAANKVANSGEAKLIATAPPSGIRLKAMTMQLCAIVWVTLRAAWSFNRRVQNTFSPARGKISAAINPSEPSARKNSTSSNE